MNNLEQKTIDKIKSDYIQNLPEAFSIENIPRQQPIHLFNQNQMDSFDSLFHPELNLFITVECENINTNEIIEVTEENYLTIKHAPASYLVKSLSFDYASALIFISLYYQDEIQDLSNENTSAPKINILYFSFALITAITMIYVFISLSEASGELLKFIIFGIAFVCLAYLYESLKAFLPQQQKKKKTEMEFHIAAYLASHLQDFAEQKYHLDKFEE